MGLSVCVACILAAATSAGAAEQAGQSAARVKELTAVLAGQSRTAIAARDPDSPDTFVAALYYPGVQLLVVAGRAPVPAALDNSITRKDFQDVYAALQDGGVKDSRVFFQDLGADGLHAEGSGNVDVLYQHGAQEILFDGNPRRQKLSAKAYQDKFDKADALYARLIGVLLEQAKRVASN